MLTRSGTLRINIHCFMTLTDTPLVSVFCVTYNHEKYIAKAIESFLMQKTSFLVEVVIGEDCSSDKTREICEEYQRRFPDKIRLVFSDGNVGPAKNFMRTIKASRGRYLAYCEGDDYWSDENKLQKQVDFLESHPDYSISSHDVDVAEADGSIHGWKRTPETVDLEYLLSRGSAGASCSLVFRNGVFGDFPDWYEDAPGGDWPLQVLCASKGKMRYFRERMGVYRRHGANSTDAAIRKAAAENKSTFALPAKYGLELSEMINKHFEYKYDKLLRRFNIYWSLFYGKEYLKIGDVASAKKKAKEIAHDIWELKYWNVFFIHPQTLLLLFVVIIPENAAGLALKILNNK